MGRRGAEVYRDDEGRMKRDFAAQFRLWLRFVRSGRFPWLTPEQFRSRRKRAQGG